MAENSEETVDLLKKRNEHMQAVLNKVINSLKEKTDMCTNLEKQNSALNLQISSLKEVVAITKNLLSIRNTEVQAMQKDMKFLEEEIQTEKTRQKEVIEKSKVLHAAAAAEYQSQKNNFDVLKHKYHEKISQLTKKNKELQEKVNHS